MLRCRAPPLPALQYSACTLYHTQSPHAHSKLSNLDRIPRLSLTPRCLATKAKSAARPVASELEETDDDLDDEMSDFDDECFTDVHVGRQVVVGDADW